MNNYFEAEQSVLGGLMKLSDMNSDIAQKVLGMVKPASFQDGRHKAIFSSIVELANHGSSCDLIMLDNAIKRNGAAERVGGIAYLSDIYQACPSAANITAYADIVRQNSIRVTVNAKLQAVLAEFNDPDGDSIYQKLGALESVIEGLNKRSNSGRENGLTHIKDIGREWLADLEERRADPEKHQGLSTGIESIDGVLGVKLLRKGSLCVAGARPKMGKTAFLGKLATHIAMDLDKTVAIFSLEMPNFQMYERFLSSETKLNSDVYYEADMTDYSYQKTSEAIGRFNKSKMFLDDSTGVTMQHIKRECRKLARSGPISMVAVDYLTLMTPGKADRNDLAFGDITKELKFLAKELDCVVLLLTQLNRKLEDRSDKRPMPSDSRDSGQIEQDADYWIGLYREAVYDESVPKHMKGYTEAIVRLNRHGGVGTGYMNMVNGNLINNEPFDFEAGKPKSKVKSF
ncbi:MAG TPA: DnaB-like helicase C-terminal domain-containing protein [Psychromonas sp.]